jgi:ATP synthase protein I
MADPHDLQQRIAAARAQQKLEEPASAGQPDAAMGIGARSGIEFVAAIVVSTGIGFLLDRWLHTSPLLLLVFLGLGFAAGLLNVYRAMNGMGYAATYKTPAAVVADDKDKEDL